MVVDSGKPLIIAVNKWDGLDDYQRRQIRNQVDRRLGFADYAGIHYISALHGSGVGKLFKLIDKIGAVRGMKFKSSRITELLETATTEHPPPLVRGRRIKLRYAHIGGTDPLRIIIHGNQTEDVPLSYRRYLAGVFRKSLKLTGTPVIIELKSGENPYKDKKVKVKNRKKKVKKK